MKKILITGANSYIGKAVEGWLKRVSNRYKIDTLDMKNDNWRSFDFALYDVIFHVAGIAHADIGKVSEDVKKKYYIVNRDLAIETAKKAKLEGVKQFIFMSSIIVYGNNTNFDKSCTITKQTLPVPSNFYGDSKLQAEKGIEKLEDNNFRIVILRPPMIYGPGCKGNYIKMAKLACKIPFFPDVKNERSMLFIDNLCELIRVAIEQEASGIFYPQNSEYVKTSDMVKLIAQAHGKKVRLVPGLGFFILFIGKFPGKLGKLVNKAFGNLKYEKAMSRFNDEDPYGYQIVNLYDSIKLTEV